jgi:hypothetical protein
MSVNFELGKVIIKEDAAFVLARAGQDTDFVLAKHLAGDWGDGNAVQNEQALREGSMLWSTYRTLRGQELLVVTFLGRQETYLFCPPPPVVVDPLVDFAHFWEQQAPEQKANDSDASAS